jgi:hypothetical protein
MSVFWPIAHLVLWGSTVGLGLLLWGVLRALGRLGWRLEQWEVAIPRVRRLPTSGTRAPAFELRAEGGGRVRLRDFAGRRVLLVFGDDARDLLPELNRLQRRGGLQVLLVRSGPAAAATTPEIRGAEFPVLRQKSGRLARCYRIVETPFAALIDERGMVAARAFVRHGLHIQFLLESGQGGGPAVPDEALPARPDGGLARPRLRDFVPRCDDIFVVTYPRSGTTWTQMILYQLTTQGTMDFAHITQVCPWFEQALRSGRELEGLPRPRVFKSHLPYRRIPKGPCRYIYVARDGKDVAISYYHFMGFRETFEDFFERFLTGQDSYGSWLRHVAGWWAHRDDPNVLFLRYEDLVRDLAGGLRTIIDFCGLDVPPERLPGILERCTFAFMKAHETQFDPLIGMFYERRARPYAHLRAGRVGGGREQLSPEQRARYDRSFGRRLERLGLDFSAPALPPRSYGPVAPAIDSLYSGGFVPCPETS